MPNESYGTKLLRFWVPDLWSGLWLLFGLAPLFFFETFIHEGLHWLTAQASGGSPVLIPFAHFNTSFGRNINGATMDSPGFIAMPQFVAFLLMVGVILLFVFTSPRSRFLRLVLTWWYLGLAVDLLFNTGRGLVGAFKEGTDWAKFAADAGSGLAVFLSWLVLLAFLSQLVWIAFSRWHENRPPAAGFFDFRPFAIFLAAVSLIAVILSFTVSHPAIVRNWWFWMIWIWQLASLAWAVFYIVRVTARSQP
ncbi:MAG: hypothetical protein IT535_13770 [Bauldia sp.]|nr:hypothetical protein [Bauldia sp.]